MLRQKSLQSRSRVRQRLLTLVLHPRSRAHLLQRHAPLKIQYLPNFRRQVSTSLQGVQILDRSVVITTLPQTLSKLQEWLLTTHRTRTDGQQQARNSPQESTKSQSHNPGCPGP